ncbi:MAG: KamA family radical SAM protein, partial [Spirochaetales bacterium]|nr:KamA family radical SAM protein [Candidatus Physcosoma equi]
LELEHEMRNALSGLAMPVYAMDLPQGGGKIPAGRNYIKGLDGDVWEVETPEGGIRRYPEDH